MLVQFTSNLVSILPTISISKKNQNSTLGHVTFWWRHQISWNLVKFWWNHRWRNHYSYDVVRVTRSSTDLYLYYVIIKCNLFIKILQRGKNTKNMKFVQNYKFPKIFRCFQQNSHCRTSESCRTLKISQNMWNRCKLRVTKTQPTPLYTFWNFSKNLNGVRG